MQLQYTLLFLLGLFTTVHALALPAPFASWAESTNELFKRKGGGGGGGRGGGSSSSGSGSGGSSTGSSGGSTGGGSRGGVGGTSSTGSGPARGYGGGQYYGGGAAVPYTAGAGSRGVTPYILGGAAFAFLPGIWLYSVYAYSWPGSYHWHNDTTNANETGPVDCLCQQYSVCGCEANNDTSYLDSVANNQSIAYKAANGTLYINGTLPDDTTAPGGEGAASSLRQGLVENSGYWFVVAGVMYAVSLL